MNALRAHGLARQRGVGLMEVMVSVVIGMLLVLVIYQVYEISEGQKQITPLGRRLGGELRVSARFGPYFLWPEALPLNGG